MNAERHPILFRVYVLLHSYCKCFVVINPSETDLQISMVVKIKNKDFKAYLDSTKIRDQSHTAFNRS